MLDIWQTVPNDWTITIKQNVWFQGGVWPGQSQLDKIQNGQLEVIIVFKFVLLNCL